MPPESKLLATLVVFTPLGPMACAIRVLPSGDRLEAEVGGKRWRMNYESLAVFLEALSDSLLIKDSSSEAA